MDELYAEIERRYLARIGELEGQAIKSGAVIDMQREQIAALKSQLAKSAQEKDAKPNGRAKKAGEAPGAEAEPA